MNEKRKLKPGDLLARWLWLREVNLSCDMPLRAKSVAFILADHVNQKSAACYPSLYAIGDRGGGDRRAVQRAIRSLEDAGFLKVDRHTGRGWSNSYELTIPWDDDDLPYDENEPIIEREKVTPEPPISDEKRVPNVTEKAVVVTDDSTICAVKGYQTCRKRCHQDHPNKGEPVLEPVVDLSGLQPERDLPTNQCKNQGTESDAARAVEPRASLEATRAHRASIPSFEELYDFATEIGIQDASQVVGDLIARKEQVNRFSAEKARRLVNIVLLACRSDPDPSGRVQEFLARDENSAASSNRHNPIA